MKKVLFAAVILSLISLNVRASNLVWTGTNNNNWDTESTLNWANAGVASEFLTGDNVTFDDTSTNGNVFLSSALQPGSVTVNNAGTAYSLSGSGSITGTSSLLKTGSGILTISTTNSYTGGTVISAGTVIASNSAALGSSGTTTLGDINTGANAAAFLVNNSVSFSYPLVASNQGTGTLTIGRTGTGTGQVTISSPITLNRDVTFQSASTGTLSLIGSFAGSGNADFAGGGATSLGINAGAWTGNISVTGSSLLETTTSGSNSLNSISLLNGRNINVEAGSAIALGTGTVGQLSGSGYVGAALQAGTTSLVTITMGAGNASSIFGGVLGAGGTYASALRTTVALTKIGTGTLTLSGNNNYSSPTTISQGTLALSGTGTIASTPSITLSPGAVLDVSALNSGTFNLGTSQTLVAGRGANPTNDIMGNLATNGALNIAGTGTAGTLTISGGLALKGGSLYFDLGNTTTVGTGINDLINISGNLSLSGVTTIRPDLLNGTISSGTYTLIAGGSGLQLGGTSNLAWGGTQGGRQTVKFNTQSHPGTIYLIVTGSAAHLIWTGSGTGGGYWSTSGSGTWSNGVTPDAFYAGDTVTFDDSAPGGTVMISSSNVLPGMVTVNNGASAYTFASTSNSGISGQASLLKTGTGTLTITNANSFTGGTVISDGTVVVTNSNGLGTVGNITLGDSNTGANNTSLLIQSSTAGIMTFSHPVVVSSQGGGTATIGRTGTGVVTISSTLTLNRDATLLSNTNAVISLTGTLTGSGNLTVNGGGMVTLSPSVGASAWSGGVSVTGKSVLLLSSTGSTSNQLAGRNLNVDAGSGIRIVTGTVGALTGAGYVGGSGTMTTLSVGAGDASSNFGGMIGGATVDGYILASSVNLVKIGAGVLTLSGTDNYSGTTTISQGTLALSGSGMIGATRLITVSPGATLDVSALKSGTFTVSNAQTVQAGRTTGYANDIVGNINNRGTLNIAGSGTAGTMTTSGNLTLTSGSLMFDFANATTPGSHVNDLINVGGSLSLTGTTYIVPNLLDGALTGGVYTLISDGSGTITGGTANLCWSVPGSRQSVAFDTTTAPGTIYMLVSGSSSNLQWSGNSGNTWDTSSQNWNVTTTGSTDKYYNLDTVTFADTATSGTVAVSGTLQPGSVTVSTGTTAYTFGGSGQIAGTASLTKSGTAPLTIANANTYTGNTDVKAGTLNVEGSIANSTVSLSSSATLAGSGTVGTISGAGAVAPGDPVILTADYIDPSGGLSFNFQFTKTGSPIYGNASASGNDVLHLTGSSPFIMSLSASNVITVDFSGATLLPGQTYLGGFYVDDSTVDDSMVFSDNPNFQYIGTGDSVIQYDGLVPDTADFGNGPVSGKVMQFSVIPEPSTYGLIGMATAGLFLRMPRGNRRRR